MTTLVQLFSAREFTPWETVLDQVKAVGFNGVEGFFGTYEDPAAFRALLDQRGLIMPQGHFGLDLLEGDFEKAIAIVKTLGVTVIIAPWLAPEDRPTTRAGWLALASRLKILNEKVSGEGFGFAWHNHDFEFQKVEDGAIPMDILLDEVPGMAWEADLGWIFRAGLDPLDWLTSRRERIVSVHLKDIQPDHETAPEGGWADLGHGIHSWEDVFTALPALPHLRAKVAEHDNPSDLQRFLSRWMASFQSLSSR
ncbi:sugar phosphate isomerase/epimerase family protein [Rhizobium sp. YIM 134829]|uniref:sugar phosphate isomerase/epimerase family protein n=1 Tax=Rhizobium sp. YIM 134829 TaxID=3390453 RepID=UPI00397AEB8A